MAKKQLEPLKYSITITESRPVHALVVSLHVPPLEINAMAYFLLNRTTHS